MQNKRFETFFLRALCCMFFIYSLSNGIALLNTASTNGSSPDDGTLLRYAIASLTSLVAAALVFLTKHRLVRLFWGVVAVHSIQRIPWMIMNGSLLPRRIFFTVEYLVLGVFTLYVVIRHREEGFRLFPGARGEGSKN